jgi:hypothetical protein
MMQNFAWAVCSDGQPFPDPTANPGGFVAGLSRTSVWVPRGTLTNTLGSVFVPDTSQFEFNSAALGPATDGGHDWIFDQGTTTCKATHVGPAGGTATSFQTPAAVSSPDCFFLPVVRGSTTITVTVGFNPNGTAITQQVTSIQIGGITDIPQVSDVITPTCVPGNLTQGAIPNPANTYFNQLGCALSGGVAVDAAHATSYMFSPGIHSGVNRVVLVNMGGGPGTEAGKGVIARDTYTAPAVLNDRLDFVVVSKDSAGRPDGKLVFAGSRHTSANVYACLNPFGDPGDPAKPLPANFFLAPAGAVNCRQIGNAGQSRIEGMVVGGDGQLYVANNAQVTNFSNFPACVTAQFPNGGPSCQSVINPDINSAPGVPLIKAETAAFAGHGNYLYRSILGGTITQYQLPPVFGQPIHQRTYALGYATPTGISFSTPRFPSPGTFVSSDGLNSMLIYNDTSSIGAPATEIVARLPICEDPF